MQKEYFTELLQTMNTKCFNKCVKNPSTRLDKTQQACLARCVDRYMDSMSVARDQIMVRSQRVRPSNIYFVSLPFLSLVSCVRRRAPSDKSAQPIKKILTLAGLVRVIVSRFFFFFQFESIEWGFFFSHVCRYFFCYKRLVSHDFFDAITGSLLLPSLGSSPFSDEEQRGVFLNNCPFLPPFVTCPNLKSAPLGSFWRETV